ncbi:hypothetical protein F4778DRAFT_386864 [Xylariomycetidae sp. FL2044]|nr:hypothetical protein F4778DRAFT_386864 [Xylariomycetidae sp. FL2044]
MTERYTWKRGRHGLLEPSRPISRGQRRETRNEALKEEVERSNQSTRAAYQEASDFERQSSELRVLLDERALAAESLAFLALKIAGMHTLELTYKPLGDPDESIVGSEQLETERRIMKEREKEARAALSLLLDVIRVISNRLIATVSSAEHPDSPEHDTPRILFRALRGAAHCRHSEHLGIHCSQRPYPPPDYESRTLEESPHLGPGDLRNHCKGKEPTNLIAMSDSPRRIFRMTTHPELKSRDEQVAVAVISTTFLIRMGVLFNRTTTLAKKFPRERRPQFACDNYWVAYRWIPAQCIVRYISLEDLRGICDKKGMGDNDFSTRLSFEDLETTAGIEQGLESVQLT